jgi:membrane protease subunit HflK
MPWQDNNGGGGRPNNPWGNGPKGGGQQPPDIDDLIKKGQEKLRGALPAGFGGKSGIMFMVLLAILLWGASGFYKVEPSEQGVVLRFGKFINKTTSGLNWHLPYPIETVYTPDILEVRSIDIGFQTQRSRRGDASRQVNLDDESLMLTGDENIIDIEFTVLWQISEPEKYLFNIQAPQERTVKFVAESAMREVIGQTVIQKALTDGRDQIERDTLALIQATLDSYESGVQISEVKLERVDPPSQVIDAFRDVQSAQADKEQTQNRADAYANQVVPEARGEAQKKLQEAEAYKEQVIANATGEASRFTSVYNEYVKAKDVTRKRIYLETMEEILAGMDKMIIDGKSGSGVVPYLPLDQLKKTNNQGGNNE